MEKLSTQHMPAPATNRLTQHIVDDQPHFLLFSSTFVVPRYLELKAVEIDTKLIRIFEVYAQSVQVGWCFKAVGRRVVLDDHSLVVSTANFSGYTLKDVLASGQHFMLKYQMFDWQYLTYNGMCSVIIVPPTPETVERLE